MVYPPLLQSWLLALVGISMFSLLLTFFYVIRPVVNSVEHNTDQTLRALVDLPKEVVRTFQRKVMARVVRNQKKSGTTDSASDDEDDYDLNQIAAADETVSVPPIDSDTNSDNGAQRSGSSGELLFETQTSGDAPSSNRGEQTQLGQDRIVRGLNTSGHTLKLVKTSAFLLLSILFELVLYFLGAGSALNDLFVAPMQIEISAHRLVISRITLLSSLLFVSLPQLSIKPSLQLVLLCNMSICV